LRQIQRNYKEIDVRKYDNNLPLIAIHIPKTGGVSFREILQGWFGNRLLLHYFNASIGEMPAKYNLVNLHSQANPIVLYGHFNKSRCFGIENYYPEVEQFITILRDPFERVVSNYFYMRKNRSNWTDQSRIPEGELRDYILNTKGSFLNFFPREVTFDNYKDMLEKQFIVIGVTEYLDESIQRIANKLNCKYDSTLLSKLNVTERDQSIPYELKDEFIKKHPLEYAVYNHVLASYIKE
jgi:hypothetical protein